MERFSSGETRILVSTTVIEVGVDVPNATIMVIEHAERFGLAQLHQLRGRIGRGSRASTCLLLYKGPLGQTAQARLEMMRESEDGFRIAEEDLRLRGEGEVLGTRQSGLARLQARPARIGRRSAIRRPRRRTSDRRARPRSDQHARRGLAGAALSVRARCRDQVVTGGVSRRQAGRTSLDRPSRLRLPQAEGEPPPQPAITYAPRVHRRRARSRASSRTASDAGRPRGSALPRWSRGSWR